MKTNREKNTAHDAKVQAKTRPKQPVYDFQPLEAAIKSWLAK